MKSINDKLERVRKPRVHIKYDIETEGAMVDKELPFTVGVIGDYSGNNSKAQQKPISQRKFVNIDRDNFNQVMDNIQPGISARVDNALTDDESELSVDLSFSHIDDFEPDSIIDQVPALKELKQIRDKLRDLLTKADRSDDLERLLEQVLTDNDSLKQLAGEINVELGE